MNSLAGWLEGCFNKTFNPVQWLFALWLAKTFLTRQKCSKCFLLCCVRSSPVMVEGLSWGLAHCIHLQVWLQVSPGTFPAFGFPSQLVDPEEQVTSPRMDQHYITSCHQHQQACARELIAVFNQSGTAYVCVVNAELRQNSCVCNDRRNGGAIFTREGNTIV